MMLGKFDGKSSRCFVPGLVFWPVFLFISMNNGFFCFLNFRHGTGKMWESGNTGFYDGTYENGKRHGHGTFIWESGNHFTGEWLDGEMQCSEPIEDEKSIPEKPTVPTRVLELQGLL